MTTDINAAEFKSFIGASNTQNGSHGLFRFATNEGEFTLALPDTELPRLMAALSDTAAKNAKAKSGGKIAPKTVMPCTLWDFALDGPGENLILSFRVPGGMELSFSIPRTRTDLLIENLAALAPLPARGAA